MDVRDSGLNQTGEIMNEKKRCCVNCCYHFFSHIWCDGYICKNEKTDNYEKYTRFDYGCEGFKEKVSKDETD